MTTSAKGADKGARGITVLMVQIGSSEGLPSIAMFHPEGPSEPYSVSIASLVSVVIAFLLGWVEIPKCDNHRLGPFVVSAVRDGAGCRLTVHWLDIVAL